MPREIPLVSYPGPGYSRMKAEFRRRSDSRRVAEKVQCILRDVRLKGDRALFQYTKALDGVSLTARSARVTNAQLASVARTTPPPLRRAIRGAAQRIRAFHARQMPKAFSMKSAEGRLSYLVKPIRRVGVYVPGGYTVYPSTVLMNVIPALVAGVEQIAVVTPPRHELQPALAFALQLLGITEIYRVGGAQGIAALAYGTKTIRRVDKIVGPGNAFVAEAKRLVYGEVDIDSIAGPSEVVILADSSVDARWAAQDLLAQAEHGSGDEMAFCVTENAAFARKLSRIVAEEIELSPVRDVLKRLPRHAITVVKTPSRGQSIAFVNLCAPEHVQVMTRTAKQDAKRIENAGAVFVGSHAPVALGDYYIGTNHVLPTGGAARYASPLGVDSFLKRMSVAEVDRKGLLMAAPHVSALARSEGFVHHALSVERRATR